MAALLKTFSACNSVAICTGFKTQGTRLEGEVATQPVRHSVGWERRREGNLDIAKETLALVEGQPLRRVLVLTQRLDPDTTEWCLPETEYVLKCYVWLLQNLVKTVEPRLFSNISKQF